MSVIHILPNLTLRVNKTKMTLSEFSLLDEKKQQEIIVDGVYIGGIDDGKHTIALYQIDDFCVSVFFSKKEKMIVRYSAYSNR